MRKLRERLSSKKGFTLVELIVVIVIILILAAVLIPNVMRYIGQARESAFQSEASGYLTEIEGYTAEHFAKYGKDFGNTTNTGDPNVFVATPTGSPDPITGANAQYTLSAFASKLTGGVNVVNKPTAHNLYRAGYLPSAHHIGVTVNKGAVVAFSYYDGTYFVNWTQSGGWDTVGKK